MNLRLQDGLAFVDANILYQGGCFALSRVLLDTGSASSVFSADGLAKIGVFLEPADSLRRIRGVGGSEFVFVKTLEQLTVGFLQAKAFAVEVGALDYGLAQDGILGMDFLLKTSAVIDLGTLC